MAPEYQYENITTMQHRPHYLGVGPRTRETPGCAEIREPFQLSDTAICWTSLSSIIMDH